METENKVFSKLGLILLMILIVLIGGYILFSEVAVEQPQAEATFVPDVILGSQEVVLPSAPTPTLKPSSFPLQIQQ